MAGRRRRGCCARRSLPNSSRSDGRRGTRLAAERRQRGPAADVPDRGFSGLNQLRDGRTIHVAVLILAVLSVGVWAVRLSSTIASGRFNITSGCEQISIFNISLMRHGEPVYTDCFSHPYRFSIFNRLFYSWYG